MRKIKILFAILGIFLLTASPAAARKAVIMAYYGTNNDNARTITIDVLTKMVRDSLPRQGKLVNLPFLGSQYLDLNELAK